MESLQPKLRFREFTGNWEKKKFSKYIKLYRGSSPRPIIKYVTDSELGVNWIKIGDTKKNDNYIIDKVSEKITLEGAKHSRKVDIGEIILANSMSFGKSYILNLSGCIYDGWFVLREYESFFNKLFLIQLLNSDLLQDQYKTLSTGGVVQNISSEIVYSTFLSKPSIQEQTKIANFLKSIDEKLNLLKEKKALLEDYKKGIMQKIFNQEIRFEDDNGNDFEEWEEKKLGDYKELIHGDGNWILSKDLSLKGKYKLIQLGNIGFGNYVEKELKTISEDKFKEIKGTILQKGDLLINRMVDNNLYCCILDKDADYITSVDVCWIRENNLFNNYFLMSILLFKENQVKLLNLSSGSGRVRISKSNLFNEFKFLMPDIKEQTKIANFLSAIDEKIELVSNQIKDTLEYKKGLLQQMFV